jgi:hypothetical protein
MEIDTMGEESDQAELPDTGQSPSPPVPEAAFTTLTDLLAIIADPREHKRRLRGYHEALTAADEAQRRLLSAQTEFSVHEDKTRTQLKEREVAVRAREVAASVAEETLREHQAGLVKQGAEIRRQDLILRRRVMVLARLDAVDERMQSLPSWKQISAELLNAEQLDLADEAEAVTERPAGIPENVTLTQTMHRGGRRSARRVSAEAS